MRLLLVRYQIAPQFSKEILSWALLILGVIIWEASLSVEQPKCPFLHLKLHILMLLRIYIPLSTVAKIGLNGGLDVCPLMLLSGLDDELDDSIVD